MRYRSRVLVEAAQFDGTRACSERIGLDFSGSDDGGREYFSIRTHAGRVPVKKNSWIVRTASGAVIVLSPEAFAELYEPAEEVTP
jgi:hypothetical protein